MKELLKELKGQLTGYDKGLKEAISANHPLQLLYRGMSEDMEKRMTHYIEASDKANKLYRTYVQLVTSYTNDAYTPASSVLSIINITTEAKANWLYGSMTVLQVSRPILKDFITELEANIKQIEQDTHNALLNMVKTVKDITFSNGEIVLKSNSKNKFETMLTNKDYIEAIDIRHIRELSMPIHQMGITRDIRNVLLGLDDRVTQAKKDYRTIEGRMRIIERELNKINK